MSLAVLAMILSGVNAIIFKVAPNIDAVTLTLVSFGVAAVTTFVYWFFFFQEKQFSQPGIWWGVAAGITSTVLLISFIKALQLGNVNTVNTIRSLSAAVSVILAVLLLGEKITILKGVGILLAIVAVVILSV